MKKPKNYYCHKSQPQQSFSSMSSNLQIVQKIGQGAFGQVFKVFDHNSSQLKVIKRHKKQSTISIINKQNQVMKQMSGSEGFAKIKQFYSEPLPKKRQDTIESIDQKQAQTNKQKVKINKQNDPQSQDIIMMQCLGENLGKLVQKKVLSIFSMKRIAYQLIHRLKQMHDKMYVHRDLKPQNILLGNQLNPHKLYLVDFGLVSTFRKQPKKIRKMYDGLIGTAKFCSIASHQGYQQFPKDDLESLGYVLIYLIHGNLPWKVDQNMTQDQKFEAMRFSKSNTSIMDLVQGVNCLRKYFNLVKSYNINSVVNYKQLISFFQTDSQEKYCFQFCKANCFQKIKLQKLEKFDDKQEIQAENKQNLNHSYIQSNFLKNR